MQNLLHVERQIMKFEIWNRSYVDLLSEFPVLVCSVEQRGSRVHKECLESKTNFCLFGQCKIVTMPSLSHDPRFNCGTGVGVITSENKIKLGNWHSVTLFRDGVNGWLRMDNNAPVTGKSQVGNSALVAQSLSLSRLWWCFFSCHQKSEKI